MVTTSLFTITSCSDDDPATPADPTISVTSVINEAAPGGKITISIAATAPGTLKTITVDDAEVKTYTTGSADAFTFDYIIPAAATLGSKNLTFKVADSNGKTSTTTLAIVVGKEVVVVDAPISTSTTWVASKKYLLKANVYVKAPAELTIEPGTIIKGDKVTKGALVINRGAKIHAVGTESNPIIFTSSAPVNFRNYGDWGGVVILGNAKNNQGATVTIEGVSVSGDSDDGKYGDKAGSGAKEDEDSGELKYVRIEFAGIALSTDNELNGLTMGSVGSGTEIDHVQVSYSGDDSFEWFGGTVNAKYLIAFKGWDDDFDTDFGYSGSVQYAVSHRDASNADKSGSNGFESDNDAQGDNKLPLTTAKFSNVSWFGPGVYAKLNSSNALNKGSYNQNYQFGAHVRRNTAIQIYNSIFIGSYLEGIHFDKTNKNAVIEGNYFGRTGVNVSGAIKKATTGNSVDNGGDIDLANFDANNITDGSQTAVDLSAVVTGMTATNLNIDAPLNLLAASSILLGNAKVADVPASLEQTTYIGAFDAATNWTSKAWVNFTPATTEY